MNKRKKYKIKLALQREYLAAHSETCDHGNLKRSFDTQRLHAGDLVGDDASCRHSNAWNVEAVVKLAMESVGAIQSHRDSHNQHLTTEIVSFAAKWKLRSLCAEFIEGVKTTALRPQWLFVMRTLDCSPFEVELGRLESLLYEACRYRHKDTQGNWRLISYEEAKKLRMRCKRGVIELLAGTLKLVWPGEAGVEQEKVPLHPVFLMHSNASTMFSAILEDTDVSMINLAELKAMTVHVEWVLLAIMTDSARANDRMKAKIQALFHDHNKTSGHPGKLLFLDLWCNGHSIMRQIIKTFRLTCIIPRLYALNFTFRFPPRYNRLVRIMRSKVERAFLEGGYIRDAEHTDQHQEWKKHTMAMYIYLYICMSFLCIDMYRNV